MISIKNTGSVIEMLLLSIDLDLKCRVQGNALIDGVVSVLSANRTLLS